jgi:SAM-dependent methyltransferase
VFALRNRDRVEPNRRGRRLPENVIGHGSGRDRIVNPVAAAVNDDGFEEREGILVPRDGPVRHQAEDYDPRHFELLLRMQRKHFWYLGRHRFVRAAVEKCLISASLAPNALAAIDMGGGCGGWVNFLCEQGPSFLELALADSSLDALRLARSIVPDGVRCYNVSVFDLPWNERWDVVFLLDVLEHLHEDTEALRQIRRTLKPGGLVVVTVPAMKKFWSYNDEVAGHRRRYSCADLARLGERAGLEVLDTRYFMFLLSPLLWASRKLATGPTGRTQEDLRCMAEKAHRIPSRPVNAVLAAVFGAEASAGLQLRFPWGTSALALFRRSRAGTRA